MTASYVVDPGSQQSGTDSDDISYDELIAGSFGAAFSLPDAVFDTGTVVILRDTIYMQFCLLHCSCAICNKVVHDKVHSPASEDSRLPVGVHYSNSVQK